MASEDKVNTLYLTSYKTAIWQTNI